MKLPPGLAETNLSQEAAEEIKKILDNPDHPVYAGKEMPSADESTIIKLKGNRMKLFLYDTKHQQVHAHTDMGDLNQTEVALVNKVLEFLQDNRITDGRYRNLTLADDIETIYVDEEPQLIIRNSR